MKNYVPDPEKWARYFTNKQKTRITIGGHKKAVISIEDSPPRVSKPKVLSINAVTPVEQQNERVKSELWRIGKQNYQQGGSNHRRSNDPSLRLSKSEVLSIDAVQQQQNEKMESKLRRIGALTNRKRHCHGGSNHRRLKRTR